MEKQTHIVTGAAGFIGCHLVERLISKGHCVIGIDNLIRGKLQNINSSINSSNFKLIKIDVDNEFELISEISKLNKNIDQIWHFAANSDIATGILDPNLDLKDTFKTTFAVAQLARRFKIKKISFSSTSAVYGDHGEYAVNENSGPLFPISNYGAMKLASEACLTALAEEVLEKLYIYRFPNVVGGRATHGIIYDFLNKLEASPNILEVLGDGTQCKPYLDVGDLLNAIEVINHTEQNKINCYNIGPDDDGLTVKEIAELVVKMKSPDAIIKYGVINKGWIGDVPRFKYDNTRIKKLGWVPHFGTSREAVKNAIGLQIDERDNKNAKY